MKNDILNKNEERYCYADDYETERFGVGTGIH